MDYDEKENLQVQEIIRKTVSDETFTLRSNTMMDEALKG